MREIKVRAWSNEHHRYCDFVTLDANGRWIGWIKVCGVFLSTADIVLEQDTGFKDRNGETVWEGDIVQFISNGTTYTRQVIYKHDCGCYMLADKDKVPYSFLEMYQMGIDEFEVIDNIHENPELLEEKKCD